MSSQASQHQLLAETERFIRDNMHVASTPMVPEIRLHSAHPGSGLRRLAEQGGGAPPYWAYQWAGGTVLARHFLDRPEAVRGKRVLDLGAGSGIVGIAAALAGAARVTACDIDPHAIAVLGLNATLNGVAIRVIGRDLLDELPPPDVDLIGVGDLFYGKRLAARVVPYLERCREAGIAVLVGDPGRAFLPVDRLRPIADYPVPDFGGLGEQKAPCSTVFAFDTAHADAGAPAVEGARARAGSAEIC